MFRLLPPAGRGRVSPNHDVGIALTGDNNSFSLRGEAWAGASCSRRTASSCGPDGSSTSVGE